MVLSVKKTFCGIPTIHKHTVSRVKPPPICIPHSNFMNFNEKQNQKSCQNKAGETSKNNHETGNGNVVGIAVKPEEATTSGFEKSQSQNVPKDAMSRPETSSLNNSKKFVKTHDELFKKMAPIELGEIRSKAPNVEQFGKFPKNSENENVQQVLSESNVKVHNQATSVKVRDLDIYFFLAGINEFFLGNNKGVKALS